MERLRPLAVQFVLSRQNCQGLRRKTFLVLILLILRNPVNPVKFIFPPWEEARLGPIARSVIAFPLPAFPQHLQPAAFLKPVLARRRLHQFQYYRRVHRRFIHKLDTNSTRSGINAADAERRCLDFQFRGTKQQLRRLGAAGRSGR